MWSDAAFYTMFGLAMFLAGVLSVPVMRELRTWLVCWRLCRRSRRDVQAWVARRQAHAREVLR